MPEFDNSIAGFTNIVLDSNYLKAAGEMLRQIFAITNNINSAMQRALRKLDEEVERLNESEQRMEADNAQLEQTLRVYEETLITTQNLITANDQIIELSGAEVAPGSVTAKVFIAISTAIALTGGNPVTSIAAFEAALVEAGIQWIVPSALDIATSFVNSPEWIAKMEGWGTGYAELTSNTILSGIADGVGPNQIASTMRQHAQDIPLAAAENLTRTLQLTSYREASLAMEQLNSDFIEGKIRIATLDNRTCMACISLHGTRLAIGERVDDHYRGRCTEFYQVVGGPEFPDMMQSDSLPGDRNFVPFQSGEDWFNSLSPERQAQQASFLSTPAKLRAFLDGVPLSDFVGEHVDDVFGHQFVEDSLVGALGKNADQYYTINQE